VRPVHAGIVRCALTGLKIGRPYLCCANSSRSKKLSNDPCLRRVPTTPGTAGPLAPQSGSELQVLSEQCSWQHLAGERKGVSKPSTRPWLQFSKFEPFTHFFWPGVAEPNHRQACEALKAIRPPVSACSSSPRITSAAQLPLHLG
jgi:hypothetical protein